MDAQTAIRKVIGLVAFVLAAAAFLKLCGVHVPPSASMGDVALVAIALAVATLPSFG